MRMEAVALIPNIVIIGDLAYETTIIKNKRHTCLGGSGYYAAIGAKAVQNENFVLISSVGCDFDFSYLHNLNIPAKEINVVQSEKTACFTTTFLNNIGEREFYADFGAIGFPNYKQIEKHLEAPFIYLAGGDPTRQLCWIKKLETNEYNGIIACDVFEKYCLEKPRESKKVIEKSDIVFLNETERRLLEYNSTAKQKVSILKKGKQGADLFSREGNIISIFPRHGCIAVDTNGAGDILAASFLSKIVLGYNYSSALQVAVDLASLSVTQENVRHILK